MAKKPEAKGAEGRKKTGLTSARAVPTLTVAEGDKRSYDDFMKLPKTQIIREMAIPENKRRFIVDVNNKTKKGKTIIALMESLRDGKPLQSRKSLKLSTP